MRFRIVEGKRKFKILRSPYINPDYAWTKRPRPPKPKNLQKSIPDSDLAANKGKSYVQALKAHDKYFYQGMPFNVLVAHV